MKILVTALLTLSLTVPVFGQAGIPVAVLGSPKITYNACLIDGWPMNEGSGTTFHDVFGTNNMTVTGSITWQSNTGLPGSTPYFNGSAYAQAANASPTNFTGTTPFSVAFWLSGLTSPTADEWLVGNAIFSSPFTGWGLFKNYSASLENQYLIFDVINSYSGNALQVANSNGFSLNGSPTFVVVTYDGSQNVSGVHVYYDGTDATSDNQTNFNSLTSSAASGLPMQVGEAPSGGIPMTGAIAALGVYNCAISSATQAIWYSNGVRVN
jgi:concanavalin A-like lectin/glucanase superfamily protein